nr:hypothetical protein [Tanacetum cinerariifolium]
LKSSAVNNSYRTPWVPTVNRAVSRTTLMTKVIRTVATLVQTPGSGISILLAVGTPSTSSGNLYCHRELSPGSLCVLYISAYLIGLIAGGDSTSSSPFDSYSSMSGASLYSLTCLNIFTLDV